MLSGIGDVCLAVLDIGILYNAILECEGISEHQVVLMNTCENEKSRAPLWRIRMRWLMMKMITYPKDALQTKDASERQFAI